MQDRAATVTGTPSTVTATTREISQPRAGAPRAALVAARLEGTGHHVIRYGLVLALAWIGAMKFTAYEAAGIQPLVAGSPLMGWLYGILGVQALSNLLGVVEIALAVMIGLRPVSAAAAAVGSGLAAAMFLTTLSFLFSTPGWEPTLGGFPALAVVPGQFLLKDVVLLGAALWSLGEALGALAAGREATDRSRPSRLAGLVVVVGLLSAIAPPVAAQEARFTGSGELVRPTGYREWIYVGTPLTPNDLNDGKAPFPEFHNVYVVPSAWAAYRRTGEFPDGTVLVKELVSVGDKQATSGRGYFMGDFIGLETAVKDAGRFADAPGHWAYFSFGHSYPLAPVARPRPVAECSACHGANAAQDYVFTQYYPVLRSARPEPRAGAAPGAGPRGVGVDARGR